MKHFFRVPLVVTGIVAVSFAIFAIAISSPSRNGASHRLAGSTKRVNSSRRARGGDATDYGAVIGKSLRVNQNAPPEVSFANTGQQPQEPKLAPDVVAMVGPVSQDQDLRKLPYIAPKSEEGEEPLRRHPLEQGVIDFTKQDPLHAVKELLLPASMPGTLFSFDGIDSNLSGCGCLPPDSHGDVGPNHYIQSANSSIRIHDKSGNVLSGPTTYNSFFAAIGPSNPCGNNVNGGDGIVFYDHLADRWVVSDFAQPSFPGTSFWQCVGVSKTPDPVAGGWYLYAVQVDPANNTFLGDYPKFGLWPDAYYLSMNEFSNNTTFNGVRQYALDRNAMIAGGAANAIGFSILPADLGDQYSLMPATFRTGDPPPAGQPEWFMSINSSAVAGTVETQVFVRRFHADFAVPANSTFGVGATHAPDGIITVNGFVDAFQSTGGNIVPNGTATATQFLDTLGDKLMTPLVYQSLGGVESIYSSHSVNNNQGGTGPVSVRWYQFNMTGNTIPATPAQQQTFDNGADGIWRWMPSINVDRQGNMAIGYSASSATINPGIRYAGRLAGDPLNNLSQGEAVMYNATGHQTSTSGRWGDYSSMFVDPSDSCTFWHVNEYYSVTGAANWRQRIGTFKFPGCPATPLPTPSPSPTPAPSPSPTPPISAGPVTVTATTGTVGPTDYPTVKAAFDAINAGTHTGVINIFILGDTTEAVAAVLNASGSGAASYTSIRMQPSGVRTVSGNLATPLIDLNGADNLTIDGSNTGGNSLTISNTNTGAVTGTSTIRFINGASNNAVMNTTISGSATVAVGTAGGNVLFSTTTGTGNNNNTISGNNIGPAGANQPVKCISAAGTTTNSATINTGDIIDSNNIFDFFIATANTTGIDIRTGNTNWMISNNRIYQTAPRTFTTSVGLRYAGITFSGSTGAGATGNFMNIVGNTIGFGAANGTGTTTITGTGNGLQNEVRGIDLQAASSGTATSVQGNTISGFNQTSARLTVTTGLSAFAGIEVSTAVGGSATGVFDIGTITGNTIGSLDDSSTIVITASSVTASTTPIFGILDFGSGSNNVSNNQIGAITIQGAGTVTGFRGIFAGATAASTHTVNNNIIGGAVAGGAINDTQVGSYALYGIQTATAAVSINGNTIRNLNGNANGAALVVGGGIAMVTTSTANVTNVSRNFISNLTNNSGTASNSIYAIDLTFTANATVTGNLVERNFIHSNSITSTDNTCQIWGIVNRGAASATATATIQNNMIRLGVDSAGNSITSGFSIIGIRDIQGAGASVVNYFYNSVYIGGTGVVSSSNTFALNSGVVTTAHNFQDNIFWNARGNASGAGKNYAIAVAGTTPNPAGLISNFNDLYASGTGGFVGLFNATDQTTLANWQTATGQDANSISADPQFVAPDAAAAAVNLHILITSPARLVGTPLAAVTNDFDNSLRPAAAPDMGADQTFPGTAANGEVSGTITDVFGVPVAGVTISLTGTESREAISDSNGNYRFDNVQANGFYSLTPVMANYHFSPANRWFSMVGNKTDAFFVAIADATPTANAIDSNEYFVRQQYLDFLGREPERDGLAFWAGKLNVCYADAACLRNTRIEVSAAFFRSQEFYDTGSFVYRLYRGALGRRLTYTEFASDRSHVMGGPNLEASKRAFASEFVARSEFAQRYQPNNGADSFVEALLQTLQQETGVDLNSQRANLVARYQDGSTAIESRALVVRDLIDQQAFAEAVYNSSVVEMEYMGYLRRGGERTGYDFWVNVLNNSDPGNYRGMVCSFITSTEYQHRFGSVVSHSNAECGQ
ncbi:MAG TPA: DUF4214 domain-containing protein [Pyrinomonadaceae bacterium]|nr:DUF4214 domain-containing protein [Pyrinomonadaceae bacterium]